MGTLLRFAVPCRDLIRTGSTSGLSSEDIYQPRKQMTHLPVDVWRFLEANLTADSIVMGKLKRDLLKSRDVIFIITSLTS